MLRLNLQGEARGNLRFAYSPLVELTISYRLLRTEPVSVTYWNWVEEAKQATSDVSFPYMDALITRDDKLVNGKRIEHSSYVPDFLTPTPGHPILDIESEFARIQALPLDLIRSCIQELISLWGPTDLLCNFLAYPNMGMQALVHELREYWQRTLAHHWNRMVAVLENDILYHSRVLTLNGIETLMSTLHCTLGYEAGAITIGWTQEEYLKAHKEITSEMEARIKPDVNIDLDSDKFHLVPLIFAHQDNVYHQVTDSWQPMVLYSSRGAGLWNYDTPEPSEALEMVMGAGKSRILIALESPFSTGELARKLALTSGAVSQQLGKLHQAGLVESHRSGKHVFYRLSQRGTQLVGLFD